MAGHSHSANIKHRKAAVDSKKAKIFSKCARLIISAARHGGGGDPDANPRLRLAIEKARAANMPKDKIERAIQKGSGEGSEGDYEELIYEGYAAAGVALMVTCLTDNRNRTASDVKHIFDKRGGNLGSPGSVSFSFDMRAVLAVKAGGKDEDALTEDALEAGADDVEVDGDFATFYASPTDFVPVKESLEGKGFEFLSAELAYVPQNTVEVADKDDAKKILRLIDDLEDNDDVQNVYANFDIPDEWIEELGS